MNKKDILTIAGFIIGLMLGFPIAAMVIVGMAAIVLLYFPPAATLPSIIGIILFPLIILVVGLTVAVIIRKLVGFISKK